MTEVLGRRMAAITGLAVAAAVALWWLGSTRLALDQGSNAGRSAADALQALWFVRGSVLAVLSVRVGALRGWRPGVASALALVAPAWPLVALAWSASTMSLLHAAVAECLLLAAGVALPLLGSGLARAMRRAELAETLATAVGAALAAALWFTRGWWLLPLP